MPHILDLTLQARSVTHELESVYLCPKAIVSVNKVEVCKADIS